MLACRSAQGTINEWASAVAQMQAKALAYIIAQVSSLARLTWSNFAPAAHRHVMNSAVYQI
jgi:hypothetical protein